MSLANDIESTYDGCHQEWAAQEVQDEEYGHSVQNRVDLPGVADGEFDDHPSPAPTGIDGRIAGQIGCVTKGG